MCLILIFSEPQITDRQVVNLLLDMSSRESCDFCFGSIFVWAKHYKVRIAVEDGLFFYRSGTGSELYYTFPKGNGDIKAGIEKIFNDARQNNCEPRFFAMTKEESEKLEELMPGVFNVTEHEDYRDYIYKTSDLAFLEGRKYHGKRNHLRRFEKDYPDFRFELINENNIGDCRTVADEWFDNREGHGEYTAIHRAFDNYTELGFTGGLLYVADTPVAFTLGERLNENTFCTHFEKTDPDFRSAYPVINAEFAKRLLEYEFINREDDAGEENLRKAKLSYYPCAFAVKYSAETRFQSCLKQS